MAQINTEKKLLIAYSLSVVMGIIITITSAITWTHWKSTLDHCPYVNCSCILYGEYTDNIFLGGPLTPCFFVTYGPIVYILFAAAFICFHGYRYLFMTKPPSTRTLMRKTGEGETIHMAVQSDDSSPLPKTFWITMSCLAVIFAVYSCIHYIIFLSGYYRTCKEYRRTLSNELKFVGSASPVIYSRLSCGGIFDFMDYLTPIPENSYRYGYIDTGLILLIGLTGSFFATILFVIAAFYNIKQARSYE